MPNRRSWMPFLVLLSVTVVLSVGTHPSGAQVEQQEAGETLITMDFQDVELPVLVKFISELTGKNFILDEKVKGKKVTVISPTKISKEEAYRVFQSILDIKGLTTVPAGKVIKILPAKEATAQNLRTVVGPQKGPVNDSMITRLLTLEHVDATEMVKILKPLMSRDSQVDSYPQSNTLIMTDTDSNISRLLNIVKQLDIKTDEMVMEVIPLEYASADVLAEQLQEILQTLTNPAAAATSPRTATPTARRVSQMRGAGAAGAGALDFPGKILADDRTNSLVILSTGSQLEKIRNLIHKLDYDTPRAYGNINVYYLEYAKAEETAKVLSDLVSGTQSVSTPSKSKTSRTSSAAAASAPQISAAVARTLASFEGEVSITADVATNALLLVATPRDYQTLKNVIQKLDIRRRQVYVEAVVMEVSPTFVEELGFEFRGGIPLESGNDVDKIIVGGSNFSQGTDQMFNSFKGLAAGSLGSAAGAGTAASSLFPLEMGSTSGLTLGSVIDRIKIPIGNGQFAYLPANMFLMHALQNKGTSNILSTPHLIAIDNEEAEIVVGRNVPFITSTSQTTVSTLQQVQRENVGITLRFTPQITEGDYIILELYQEISALVPSPVEQDVNKVGPTTSTRKATNVVLCKDGQTIIVGGLMEDRITREKSLVPWLGEIPLLGWLFRWQRDKVDKNNLMIFLTPTIVREDQDVQRFFEDKMRRMQEYKARHKITDKYLDILPFEEKAPPAAPAPVEETGASPRVPQGPPPGTPERTGPASKAGPEAVTPGYTVTIHGARQLGTPEETTVETPRRLEPQPESKAGGNP